MTRPGLHPVAIGVCVAVGIAGLAMVGGMVAAQVTVQEEHGSSHSSSSARSLLQAELDATRAAGLPASDPKVQMLEEEIAALEALEDTEPVPEPWIDPTEPAAGGGQRDASADASEQWDVGQVECEPMPGLLTAEEMRDARCRVEPQAGGALYIVTFPDGTEQAVPFGDGTTQAPVP